MTRKMARMLAEEAMRSGGFTYDLASNSFPQSGFAFSEAPEHEAIVRRRELPASVIRRYVREHLAALRSPGAHLGAWKDYGVWYLDVTHVEPDEALARVLARINEQLAVYDLATRASLFV